MPEYMLLIIKINPVDLEKIDETIAAVKTIKSGQVKDVQKKPIGFGVEIVKAGVLVGSKDEAAPEKVINEINALKEVEDAEIAGMTLI